MQLSKAHFNQSVKVSLSMNTTPKQNDSFYKLSINKILHPLKTKTKSELRVRQKPIKQNINLKVSIHSLQVINKYN